MNKTILKELQYGTQILATQLGEDLALFGMTLNGIHWTDGNSGGDMYWPTDKRIGDFTKKDCLLTMKHILEWWEAYE